MPAEFTRIPTLPNSAQTANLNDRPRRGWRANSGPQQHKAKTEGNENQSEENSTEELAHFLPTKPESGTALTTSKSLLRRKCPRKQYPAAAGQQILAAVEFVGDRRTLNVRA